MDLEDTLETYNDLSSKYDEESEAVKRALEKAKQEKDEEKRTYQNNPKEFYK